MAFWNAPEALADHPARACAAALRSYRCVVELAAKGVPLAVRIGVATGDVLVGNIGSHERMNYTAIGDAANLAARLESLNKQYDTSVMIAESTRLAAGDAIVARPVDVVAVKGTSRGVRVYELLALAGDDDDGARALAATSTVALDAYLARDFAKAAAAWDDVLALRPDDRAATMMRDRARAFATSPPDAEWTGVTIATEK
jgi:adenylate cyclase